MFTFSRSTQIKTVLGALAALLLSLLLTSAAEARGMKLSPSRQTITVGQVARGAVSGKRCSVRLPSRKVVRSGKRGKSIRWAWRAKHSGRFIIKARCGRSIRSAAITVKRVNPDDQFGGGDYTDWNNNTGNTGNTEPPAPKTPEVVGTPNASMDIDHVGLYYKPLCVNKLQSAACANLVGLMADATVKHVLTTCAWFKNCEGGKYPNGNPYNLANNGGICSDWAYYKRPDIKIAVEKNFYKQWLLDGTPLLDIGYLMENGEPKWGTYTSPDWGTTTWSKTDAWTTWASRYGFKVSQTPRVGSIMVQGNHVAYVEALTTNSDREKSIGYTRGGFRVSEMNTNGHRGIVNTSEFSAETADITRSNQWFVG